MKKNLYWLIILTAISLSLKPSSATFFKPVSYLPEVQPTDPNYASFEFEYSHGKAEESFNIFEKAAPLLGWHGSEELLNRLAYPELYDYNDSSSVGKAHIVADYAGINEFAFHLSKNFKHGLFVSSSIFMRDIALYNIGFSVVRNEETDERYPTFVNVPPEEMAENPALYDWCTVFPFLSGAQGNNANVKKYNLANCFFRVGYTKKLEPLAVLESTEFTIQAGIMTPELYDNYKSETIHFYFGDRTSFGFCFDGALLVSYSDWINIGAAGSILTSLETLSTETPMSVTATNNAFFENNVAPAIIKRGIFTYFNVHYEMHNIVHGLNMMLGFSYSKQRPNTFIPLDKVKYPVNEINKNNLNNKGWSSGAVHLQVVYDPNVEGKEDKPVVSLAYTRPVKGNRIFISRIIAGSCSLGFRYKF